MQLKMLLLAVSSLVVSSSALGVNGGTGCAACTFIAAIVQQREEEAIEKICGTGIEGEACRLLLKEVYHLLQEEGVSPDGVCHTIGECNSNDGGFCHLYPEPATAPKARNADAPPSFCTLLPLKPICDAVERIIGGSHMAVDDIDEDGFSKIETLRGTSWKGRDCADVIKEIHPFKSGANSSFLGDGNCNGVLSEYEHKFCTKVQKTKGVIAIGDTAMSHFHIPPAWVDPNVLDFSNAEFVLENELSFPQHSWATGWKNISDEFNMTISGPVRSIYERLKDLDRCAHRFYQNVGVFGARSGNVMDIVKTASITPEDAPSLITYSLVGMDVCNAKAEKDTIANMTTPEDFVANNLAVLQYLDSVLPEGSSVFTTGLLDGRILYDNLATRVHPISGIDGIVKYADMYTYLNCLQLSPCVGWMNTNETLRNFTSKRASDLGAAWGAKVAEVDGTFKNIRVAYGGDFPVAEVVTKWIEQGGEAWQLIEPVDGFHPNQQYQAIASDLLWDKMVTINQTIPGFLPTRNPHNAEIEAIFKDQGGY